MYTLKVGEGKKNQIQQCLNTVLSKIAQNSITNCDFFQVYNLCYGQPL